VRLKVEEEFNMIDARLRSSEHRENLELSQRHAVSLADLQELILRFRPNIIHFSGHGSTQGTLVFEDSTGYPEEAPPDALANLFRILNEDPAGTDEDKIRCVVLSACYSNKKQADAICKHVECVIGISKEIEDSSALNFAQSFYQALGYGENVNKAFELGRNQLELYDDPNADSLGLCHRKEIDEYMGTTWFCNS